MTLITSAYTVGGNEPLNHARILWDFKPGTVIAGGQSSEFAANDYTAQRWAFGSASSWVFQFNANQPVDTFVIAAHNLAGKTVTVSTSSATSGAFTARASIVPPDNTPIFIMVNESDGSPISVRRYRVSVGAGAAIGIIRAGLSLQMQRSLYGGHREALFNRVTEGQQSFSETGQWLGRTRKRLAYSTSYTWEHITRAWYRDNFEPFAQTLPLKPFAIAGNPESLPRDVAWAWAQSDVAPETMGMRDYITVSLPITGYGG